MADPGITLIITQRESYAQSRESLESVLKHTPHPFELIYVDAASPPRVRDQLREMAAAVGFRLLREDKFLPPNQAKCLALPLIQTKYSLFLDNDVLVHPEWLQRLVECAEETQAGAVAPLYLERVGRGDEKVHMSGGLCRIVESGGNHRRLVVTHDERKGRFSDKEFSRQKTEHIEMHCLLVRTRLLHEHQLFDPEIVTIPENLDFCLNLAALGEEIWMEPRAKVTVLLPDWVNEEDVPFFTTRWSDGWTDRGFRRFRNKWRLTGHQPVLESQREWAVAHRLVAYSDSFHRRLGIKSDSKLNRRLLAPLERRLLNR